MGPLLSPNGTALYATVRAAMRQARASYDPDAVNSVVLFTDGRNEKDRSVSLSQVVRELRADATANPTRPISLIAIGMGPDADMPVLRAIAQASGGRAYRADTASQMQLVMFDALASRRG
jgi:Mg-chelatase subunit ChlD